MNRYSDILYLPRRDPRTRPRMTIYDRAAQFAAFKALTGFEDEIDEAARLTDRRPELSEDDTRALNEGVARLKEMLSLRPEVGFEIFVPDSRKDGGKILSVSGRLRVIDEVNRKFILTDRRELDFDSVLSVSAL